MQADPLMLIAEIRKALTPDLLQRAYSERQAAGAHPMTGHCFVASEALWHALGGLSSGFTPCRVRASDGGTHWWVVGPDHVVYDPTFDQFPDPVAYDQGRCAGFGVPGGGPSRRARVLLSRLSPPADVVALFVRADGPYPRKLRQWYDQHRDARTYSGNLPVVAHPPCSKWSAYGNATKDDGGLFDFALATIKRVGGVIEHPARSLAWQEFGLPDARQGLWSRSMFAPGLWCTEVCQRNYGHRARKPTWLCVASPVEPPPLDWSEPAPAEVWSSWSSKPYMAANPTAKPKMMRRERETTPDAFADLLIGLARMSRP